MTDFKIRFNGVPLDKITLTDSFKQYLQSIGLQTLEQLLGAMLVTPEAYKPLCEQYGTTYDALKKQIYEKLPPETIKRLEDGASNRPGYNNMGNILL